MRIEPGVVLSATENEIISIVEAGYPGRANVYVTSGVRNGDPGYHGRGLAVDFGADSQGPKDDLAAWLYQYYSTFLELIHTRADGNSGWYAKNGNSTTGSFYGAATVQQHINHVHIAVDPADLATFRRIAVPAVAPSVQGVTVPLFGLDATASPPINAMKAAGVSFICRYLSTVNSATRFKLLTNGEALTLSQNGIAVVSNFEWYTSRAREGYGAGAQDAQTAEGQHLASGGLPGRPIYFSVDEDTTAGAVASYFDGVSSVIGHDRTGVYGSYGVCKDLVALGKVKWTWQTYAWSGGNWYPGRNIEQYSNDHTVGGQSVDYDHSLTDDYGQWYHVALGHQPAGVGQAPKVEDDMTPEQDDRLKRVEATLGAFIQGLLKTPSQAGLPADQLFDIVPNKQLAKLDNISGGGLSDADRALIKGLTDAAAAVAAHLK